MVISVVGAVALLLLALSVFAVASQAQSLSSQAEQSVQSVENLRVVSVARSELSVASRVAEVAPGEGLVIDGGIENSQDALASVEASLDSSTSEEIRTAVADFRTAVDAQAALLTQGTSDLDTMQSAELATGETFTALADALRTEQVASFEALQAANDLMNLIATVATFVVAFVVPSAGLFIFQALRTAPREHRKLQLEYDRLETASQAMASTVSTESSELRTSLVANGDIDASHAISRSLLRFENIAAFNGAHTSIRNERLSVNEIVRDSVAAVDDENVVSLQFGSEWYVVADRGQLSLAVAELVTNALEHGANPVDVSVAAADDSVEIHVMDRGRGLPEDTPGAVLDEDEFALRERVGTGVYGFGILTARRSVEAMDGTLRYVRRGNQTQFILTLPLSLSSSGGGSNDLPAAA